LVKTTKELVISDSFCFLADDQFIGYLNQSVFTVNQWCRTETITRGGGAVKGERVTRCEGDKAWRVQHGKHGKFQYFILVLVILQLVFFAERT
jgi:hypothetical protein